MKGPIAALVMVGAIQSFGGLAYAQENAIAPASPPAESRPAARPMTTGLSAGRHTGVEPLQPAHRGDALMATSPSDTVRSLYRTEKGKSVRVGAERSEPQA